MDPIGNILSQHKHSSSMQPAQPQDETPINNPLSTDSLDHLFDEIPLAETQSNTTLKPEEKTSHVDLLEVKSELFSVKLKIEHLLNTLEGHSSSVKPIVRNEVETISNEGTVLEGVFNGEKMIGPDGKEYAVPPNYASKSKLVEGDILKLTIRHDGSFLYKQIGPTPRKRIVGKLKFDVDTQKWMTEIDGSVYKILTASVTFYKGSEGDEVIILLPESGPSSWGAVENIIPQ